MLDTNQFNRITLAMPFLQKADASLINELKQKFTLAKIPSYCRPVFHHRYLLSRLAQEGYRLALCSNSVRRTVDEMMRAAELDMFFELTLSNEDIKLPKPDPEI